MIEEVKSLLDRLEFSKVAIIDDAYDETPVPNVVQDLAWSRFFDDMDDGQEALLREEFGGAEYDRLGQDQLKRDGRFVGTVWATRDKLGSLAADLFHDFQQGQASKRSALVPLEQLLEEKLKISCKKTGRRDDPGVLDAQIVFLDLFLGATDDEGAVEASIEKVKQIVQGRKDNPPVVVLMSASARLDSFAPLVRDKAQLLGCQFRTVKKSQLSQDTATLEKLFDLVVCYPDSKKLNAFVNAWDSALTDARADFLRTIRNLDLSDYANMQALILEAEGEPVGDYVIDLYDLYLHDVIEGKGELIRAAKALNQIKWDDYPPAQFMPSAESTAIMDGALFHNEERTKIETEVDGDAKVVRFGDVFLSSASPPEGQALGSGAPSGEKPTSRLAYMVMSQACDLAHGDGDRVLLLEGTVRPYKWRQHDDRKRDHPTTPIMIANGEKLALEWDLLAPQTWKLDELASLIKNGSVRLARRFRTPFALHLQELFLQKVGRVGTPAALPARYAAGVRIFLRTPDGKAKMIAQSSEADENAVCLVGRTAKNNLKEWLLLSEPFCRTLADALVSAKATPPKHDKDIFLKAIDDPAFHRAMKAGLEISRERDPTRPFKDGTYDLVEASTKKKWNDGEDIGTSGKPILVEVTLS